MNLSGEHFREQCLLFCTRTTIYSGSLSTVIDWHDLQLDREHSYHQGLYSGEAHRRRHGERSWSVTQATSDRIQGSDFGNTQEEHCAMLLIKKRSVLVGGLRVVPAFLPQWGGALMYLLLTV